MPEKLYKNFKVFLTGRDFVNWATDDDFFTVKKSLRKMVEFAETVENAEVIHAINWHSLLNIARSLLRAKIVIAHIPHDLRNMLGQPEYLKVAPYVDYWVVPSDKAKFYAEKLKLNHIYVPYAVDPKIFFPIGPEELTEIKEKYNLPVNKYLIGSFQRDTEGADLITPKYIKGPDIFLEIVKNVYRKNKNIHIVLAGPRRFWLLKKLRENKIPVTFVGREIDNKDDLKINTLDHRTINELYNALDLYLVSSRMEGGPKAILECAASKTKIISTDVGLAKDILAGEQIYDNFIEAKELIIEDIADRRLDKFRPMNFSRSQNFSTDKLPAHLEALYSKIADQPGKIKNSFKPIKVKKWRFRDLIFSAKKHATIFFKFHDGPWGGGNQFLKALSVGLKKQGWKIANRINSFSKIVLFNSFHIDFEKAQSINVENKLIVHRIDGPTFLIRGKDKDLDDKIFQVNEKIADVTVFQSAWSLLANLASGYQPVNPIIISNAANPDFFNHNEKTLFPGRKKIRLITTCWSDNPTKGGSIYKWLDDNLDWNKFEYTYIGRVAENFSHIKLLEPLPTVELAKVLKQHDIFIAASDNDPCSNSLVEGLSCKLPTIYFNRGGHPELVGFGGLGFESKEEIPSLLNLISDNFDSFQNLVNANNLKKITDKYIECFKLYEK